MNRAILSVLLLVVFGCQTPLPEPPAQPTVVRTETLDGVATTAATSGFPGVTIAVAFADGSIRTGAAGLADRANGVAMTSSSQVHAASTTKAVTAAAVLMLVDRGALALDATLPTLLPAELLEGIPHAANVTLRDLLLHTSGLYSPNNDLAYLARYIGEERITMPFWRPEEIVAFATNPANSPAFAPGQGQSYSDINYVLLGLIVAEVAGRSLPSFVQAEIFDPLDMADTWYLSTHPDRPRTRAYTVDSEILRSVGLDPAFEADAEGLIDTTDAQEQSDAAAGIITTMTDLARFAHALTLGDLLSEASRDLVLEVAEHGKSPDEDSALGILRSYAMPYGTIVTAEGDGPGTNVVWALHLESERIVAVAVNLFGRWDENELLLQQVIPEALAALD